MDKTRVIVWNVAPMQVTKTTMNLAFIAMIAMKEEH
jgi:hypothetical protein